MSSTTISVSSGRKSKTVSVPGSSSGASASAPGGTWPRKSESISSSAARAGTPCASARSRSAAERSITNARSGSRSRGGGATTLPSGVWLRWLAASNSRIDSTSSPSSSMRTGSSRCGGKTSSDAAAHRQLAALLDERRALVAGRDERLHQARRGRRSGRPRGAPSGRARARASARAARARSTARRRWAQYQPRPIFARLRLAAHGLRPLAASDKARPCAARR